MTCEDLGFITFHSAITDEQSATIPMQIVNTSTYASSSGPQIIKSMKDPE